MESTSEKNISEKKFVELEAKLIEQEHRPITIILNFINRFKYWSDGDIRRDAAIKAVIWRLLFSPTTIAVASGGLLGFITLYFLYQQNILLNNQNDLLTNQNMLIGQQSQLAEASRRSSQMFIMGEVLSDITKELNNVDNRFDTISQPLWSRVISVANAMMPYRYLENDKLIDKPLSPERGQLLTVISRSNVSEYRGRNLKVGLPFANFEYSDLKNVDLPFPNFTLLRLNYSDLSNSRMGFGEFYQTKFRHAVFVEAFLYKSNFDYADLSYSDMTGANLEFSSLSNTNLTGANLTNVRLTNTKIDNIILCDTKMDGVIVSNEHWINNIYALGYEGSYEIYNHYFLKPIPNKSGLMTRPDYKFVKR